MFIHHPGARESSRMLKQDTVCDGKKTGKMCKYYWATVNRVDVANPEHLKKGGKMRLCLLPNVPQEARDLGDGGDCLAVYCTHYEASERDFNAELEEYNPLTKEELTEIDPLSAADPRPEGSAPALRVGMEDLVAGNVADLQAQARQRTHDNNDDGTEDA